MASTAKSATRAQFVEEMKKLAAERGVTIASLLTRPDQAVKSVLARASEAGATHAIESAASEA